jgi:seryl-tRNA synthetase
MRGNQFNKAEMFQFTTPEQAEDARAPAKSLLA